MPEISVVVAVYGVEKYLRQCIESIINQTFRDLEIILVDDGSKDNCPYICDEYAQKDSRIRVIHQTNQGSVCARKNGLLNAKGEYVSFIDGDDWLELDMYEIMIALSDNRSMDIVTTGYLEDVGGSYTKKENIISSGVYYDCSMENVHKAALFTGRYYEAGIIPALWNKLIKRELLMSLDFPHPLLKMGEDAGVSYPVIAKAKSVRIANDYHLYHYRIVDGSMSKSIDERYFERALLLINGLQKNLEGSDSHLTNLKYYGLFISQIGMDQILSKRCKRSLRWKRNTIKKYWIAYSKMNLFGGIDWNSFDDESERVMRAFVKGKIVKLIIYKYIQALMSRII